MFSVVRQRRQQQRLIVRDSARLCMTWVLSQMFRRVYQDSFKYVMIHLKILPLKKIIFPINPI